MVLDVKETVKRAIEDNGLTTIEKDRFHQGLIELMLDLLRSINQFTQESMQSVEPGQQAVIFKKMIQCGCFTLLYSPVSVEETDDSTTAVDLSPREHEIVRLTSHGLSNKAIAAVLDISPWTVNTYIRRIFTKLNVNTRAEMVAVAARTGKIAIV